MKHIFILFIYLFSFQFIAQNTESANHESIFPEKCLGIWEGTMYIFNQGQLRDSVKIRFTAKKTDTGGAYIWKTEYLSPTKPIVKDYKLIVDDLNKGRYILDEGDGIQLVEYNIGNKLHCLFTFNDIYLTSSTELIGDQLIFEVTSGKELNNLKDIKNYSFTNVQRAVLERTN